jgi:hypothetical protein
VLLGAVIASPELTVVGAERFTGAAVIRAWVMLGRILHVVAGAPDEDASPVVIDSPDHAGGQQDRLAEDPATRVHDHIRAAGLFGDFFYRADAAIERLDRHSAQLSAAESRGEAPQLQGHDILAPL